MGLLSAAVTPQTAEQLVQAYLLWFVVFLLVNVVWDIFTPHTPKFHIHRLKDKVGVVVGSTSFCSSVLIIGATFNDATRDLVGNTPATLVIAAGAGFLMSIAYLCPYEQVPASVAPPTAPPAS